MPVKPPPHMDAWSYSRWKDYVLCPFKAKCKHIDKMREPENPAMARGQAIHKKSEDFLNGIIKGVPAELKTFAAEFRTFRKLKAVAEQQWAFTKRWQPTSWFGKDAWCRIKVDIMAVFASGTEAIISDVKTGKKYPEHEEQLSLYAVGGFLALPDVQEIETQMAYVDIGEEFKKTFLRENLLDERKQWERNVSPMMNDTRFAPRPGGHCTRCHYRKSNGGPCKF